MEGGSRGANGAKKKNSRANLGTKEKEERMVRQSRVSIGPTKEQNIRPILICV